MVVFTCAHCGESLQKPKVEKHYDTKCRNKYPDLCCVDCLKDFRGDEFKIHTKCVSEAERYGGKGYVAKAGQNKGEKKQNAWIEIVQSVLDENTNLPGKLRGLLERVSHQPNTPRKKPKFVNFVKSMDHRIQMGDIERAWDLLSAKLDLLKTAPRVSTPGEASASNGDVESKEDVTPMEVDQDVESPKKKKGKKNKENEVTSNGHEESNGDIADKTIEDNVEELALTKKERKEKKKKEKYEAQLKAVAQESSHMGEDDVELKRKGKKRKFDDAIEEPIQKSNGINKEISENVENIDGASKKKKNKDGVSEFDWTNTIITVVESKKKDIALKKLQKRVLTEYCVVNGVSEITERITKKFNKSLYKIQNLKIENDKVRLVTEDE